MAIYGFIRTKDTKENMLDIIKLSDKLYYSIEDVIKDIENFKYGDIIITTAAGYFNGIKEDLDRKGIIIRQIQAGKVNMDSILDYDKAVRMVIDSRSTNKPISLKDAANILGIKYSRLSYYTGYLLSRCNNELYKELNSSRYKGYNDDKLKEFEEHMYVTARELTLDDDIDYMCDHYGFTYKELCTYILNKI